MTGELRDGGDSQMAGAYLGESRRGLREQAEAGTLTEPRENRPQVP